MSDASRSTSPVTSTVTSVSHSPHFVYIDARLELCAPISLNCARVFIDSSGKDNNYSLCYRVCMAPVPCILYFFWCTQKLVQCLTFVRGAFGCFEHTLRTHTLLLLNIESCWYLIIELLFFFSSNYLQTLTCPIMHATPLLSRSHPNTLLARPCSEVHGLHAKEALDKP